MPNSAPFRLYYPARFDASRSFSQCVPWFSHVGAFFIDYVHTFLPFVRRLNPLFLAAIEVLSTGPLPSQQSKTLFGAIIVLTSLPVPLSVTTLSLSFPISNAPRSVLNCFSFSDPRLVAERSPARHLLPRAAAVRPSRTRPAAENAAARLSSGAVLARTHRHWHRAHVDAHGLGSGEARFLLLPHISIPVSFTRVFLPGFSTSPRLSVLKPAFFVVSFLPLPGRLYRCLNHARRRLRLERHLGRRQPPDLRAARLCQKRRRIPPQTGT